MKIRMLKNLKQVSELKNKEIEYEYLSLTSFEARILIKSFLTY